MLVGFSQGKLVLSPQEILVKLNDSGVTLNAMAEDLCLIGDALILSADAGAVRWHLRLDDIGQLQQIADFYGIEIG